LAAANFGEPAHPDHADRYARAHEFVDVVTRAQQLAAHVIAWQDAGAVDGFTIMGSTLPNELTTFADHVVPILQRRGRFRTEYTGHTLRDHLGLQRP
jgi:alkanesulfonate monooxygenase SsuD/methylene tetrahydromethanopterin reductase-like flavin-dependent oxidoreductase (luciferase family)